jgi:hypothetical protein
MAPWGVELRREVRGQAGRTKFRVGHFPWEVGDLHTLQNIPGESEALVEDRRRDWSYALRAPLNTRKRKTCRYPSLNRCLKLFVYLSVKRIFLIVPTVPLCGEGRDEGVAGRGPVRDKYKVCNMFNIS